jgi:hypothetical protein
MHTTCGSQAGCALGAIGCRMVIGPTGLSWSSDERVGENMVCGLVGQAAGTEPVQDFIYFWKATKEDG